MKWIECMSNIESTVSSSTSNSATQDINLYQKNTSETDNLLKDFIMEEGDVLPYLFTSIESEIIDSETTLESSYIQNINLLQQLKSESLFAVDNRKRGLSLLNEREKLISIGHMLQLIIVTEDYTRRQKTILRDVINELNEEINILSNPDENINSRHDRQIDTLRIKLERYRIIQ